MCITSKKLTSKLSLINNLIVWPDASTLFMASFMIDLTAEYGRFCTAAATECLHSLSDGAISVQCRATRILIRTYKFTSAKTLLSLRIFMPLNP